MEDGLTLIILFVYSHVVHQQFPFEENQEDVL